MNCIEVKDLYNMEQTIAKDIFEGVTKVIFYNSETKKYISYSNGISATAFVINELNSILGKENVVLK